MDDRRTLLTLGGIMTGTLLLILGFAFWAARPPKPVNIDIGNAYYRGNKDAKVTIVEFSDYECPSCEAFATDVLPKLLSSYQNKIKFVNKFFPLYEIHKMANITAQSAFCAGKVASATDSAIINSKFWEYHDYLMSNSSDWIDKPEKLTEYAQNFKLNKDDFIKCQNSNEAITVVSADRQQGQSLGVDSTPTFFINGEKVVGLQTFEVWKKKIEEKLR